jgi:hypothetical protein
MEFLRRTRIRAAAAVVLAASSTSAMALYGITWETGELYSINPDTAAVTKIGATNVKHMADIQMGADGFLYGFSTGYEAKRYKINPTNAATTELGAINFSERTFVFEGAMVDMGDGTYWCSAANDAGSPKFFQLNIATGAVVDSFTVDAELDINGWAPSYSPFEDALYGLDRESRKIKSIDLSTKAVTDVIDWPGDVGEVGGMTVYGDYYYIATGGAGAVIPGSNRLFRVETNPIEFGAPQAVGPFTGVGDYGFSGIAAPEPSILLAVGIAALVLRRKKK